MLAPRLQQSGPSAQRKPCCLLHQLLPCCNCRLLIALCCCVTREDSKQTSNLGSIFFFCFETSSCNRGFAHQSTVKACCPSFPAKHQQSPYTTALSWWQCCCCRNAQCDHVLAVGTFSSKHVDTAMSLLPGVEFCRCIQ